MFIIRIDDACEYMDTDRWECMENVLDKNNIKPIVAIIPNCQDKEKTDLYKINTSFWQRAKEWQDKGWIIALHGYNHCFDYFNVKGINGKRSISEFAGATLDIQCQKIEDGIAIFSAHQIYPKVFVAPAHSFDKYTLEALKRCSDIRIISDTIANDIYNIDDFFYIPQQCDNFRMLPMKMITGCYHPNSMNEEDFVRLERFICKNRNKFINLDIDSLKTRQRDNLDNILRFLYVTRRKLKGK